MDIMLIRYPYTTFFPVPTFFKPVFRRDVEYFHPYYKLYDGEFIQ